MNEPSPRFWEIFFQVYEPLPRQGPGNRACAEKALAVCRELPQVPEVLDLGCGVGGQTLHLADLTRGSIMAVDSHEPSIERFQSTSSIVTGVSRCSSTSQGADAPPGIQALSALPPGTPPPMSKMNSRHVIPITIS